MGDLPAASALGFDTPMPELTRRQSLERRQQKITLGEMRSSGVRGLLIYCADYKCSHSTTITIITGGIKNQGRGRIVAAASCPITNG
jgi:hypothetical protein